MQNLKDQAREVLNYFERKTGVIQSMSSTYYNNNLIYVLNRLREGAGVEQCKNVIDKKFFEWNKHPRLKEYLQPHVLFSKHNFKKYMN